MPQHLFTESQRADIIQAIEAAEKRTSGEIQVHLENHCSKEVLERAAEVFEALKMHKTKFRNGVLFYIAVEDHKFAILGDKGINELVPSDFWQNIKDEMRTFFIQGQFTEGLIKGIHLAGEQLSVHFPFEQKGDDNELSNEISFGS